MPKDVYYFKHDANAQSDPKIKALRKHYGWEGYGWYWLIIELMRSETDYKLAYNNIVFDSLAGDMGCDNGKAKKFIDDCVETFKLFSKNETNFYSNRLIRDMKVYEAMKSQRTIAGKISGVKRSTRSTDAELPLSTRSTDAELPLKSETDTERSLNNRSTDAELVEESIVDRGDILNKEEVVDNNVFKIYENNIGIITPFIAEELKDIENTYPLGWFGEAVKEACRNNARSLKYIMAILERWKVQGFKSIKQPSTSKYQKDYDPRKRYKRVN